MPHSLIELNGMSEEQLRSVAETLNIKNTKKMERADLGFAILDAEAVIESQKPAETKPKKRASGKKKAEPEPEVPVPFEIISKMPEDSMPFKADEDGQLSLF